MTATKGNKSSIDFTKKFTKLMYILFVALAVYYLAVPRELGDAMSMLGVALIFDPFDQTVDWKRRPHYQNVWLIVHATSVLTLLALTLI